MVTTQSTMSTVLPEHEDDPGTFHIFVMVRTTRHWLDLKTEQRHAFLQEEIIPLLRRRPELKIRWFEPEAFSTRATDIMICETRDLSAWAWFCDHLRETRFWDHYFDVLDIMPALEGNYLG